MNFRILTFALLTFAFASVANAIPVTVNSVEYDITTITTTFDSDSTLLMSQPWWLNAELASQLAEAVGYDLGTPNVYDPLAFGPYFAYTLQRQLPPIVVYSKAFPYTSANDVVATGSGDPTTYAIVARVPDSASTLILTAAGVLAALFVKGRSKRVLCTLLIRLVWISSPARSAVVVTC